MTEDEKIRADYAASVSLLTEAERQKLWNDAKAYCRDWKVRKIPRTPANSTKLQKQLDIFIIDADPAPTTDAPLLHHERQTKGCPDMSQQTTTDLTPEVRVLEAARVTWKKACAMYGEDSPEAAKAHEALNEVIRKTITRLDEVWLAEAEIGTPH